MQQTKKLLSELEKFELKGKFYFNINDDLGTVCNIPKVNEYIGIYVFYAQSKELIYVGISGREDSFGKIIPRKDGLRGRFLKGKQFGDRRKITFPIQMKLDGISTLEIHWFVTNSSLTTVLPRSLESAIIQTFRTENEGKRPKWNKKD